MLRFIEYIKDYNNPYKLGLDLNFMAEERYYLAEKVKERFMIGASNMNVIKQTGNKLEMLSSKVIKPAEIGVKLNKGVVSCVDNNYKLKEITEKKAIKILKDANRNSASWQDFMSTSEEMPSLHLGFGGEQLY
jgi:hypothetical protein